MLTIDSDTGDLELKSFDYFLISRQFTFDVQLNSSDYKQTISVPFHLNETYISPQETERAVEYNLNLVQATVLTSIVGAIGNTLGVNGVWMLVNQQQMLKFLLLVDTVIHADVRYYIAKHNFVLFTFNFLPDLNIFGLDLPKLFSWMEQPHDNSRFKELDYETASAVQTHSKLLLIYFSLILVSILILLFRLLSM